MIRPLKRFGQNFLQDQNILRKIVDEINPQPDDLLIEIGPGQGALTEKLLEKNLNLIAIEIDNRSVDELKNKFPGLNVIQSDFLEVNLYSFIADDRKK